MDDKNFKTYKFEVHSDDYRRNSLGDWIIQLIGYTLVMITVSVYFDSFYIDGFLTAFLASLLVAILNSTIRPLLYLLSLPLIILTFGLFLPVVNALVLNIVDWILGSSFEITGTWTLIFVSILISLLNIMMNNLIIKPLKRRRK